MNEGNMPSITPKQALETLEDGRAQLQTRFDALSDDDMVRPATIGGGDWSAKDLLGHISFWEELAVGTIADWRAGREPSYWNQFATAGGADGLNAQNQVVTSTQTLAEVRWRAKDAHKSLIRGLGILTDVDWNAILRTPWGKDESLGDVVGGILGAPNRPFGHAFAHVEDLTAYVESRHN
jgi:hypothetical protein